MMKRITIMRLAGAALLWCGTGWAQNSTGSIAGTVSDPSAAVVVGAKMSVINQDTGLSRMVQTNGLGQFIVSSLPVRTYSVRAEKEGFRSTIEKNITLEILQVRTVDFRLELGSVSDTVSVYTGDPLLDTETSQAGQVIKNEQVSALPINVR